MQRVLKSSLHNVEKFAESLKSLESLASLESMKSLERLERLENMKSLERLASLERLDHVCECCSRDLALERFVDADVHLGFAQLYNCECGKLACAQCQTRACAGCNFQYSEFVCAACDPKIEIDGQFFCLECVLQYDVPFSDRIKIGVCNSCSKFVNTLNFRMDCCCEKRLCKARLDRKSKILAATRYAINHFSSAQALHAFFDDLHSVVLADPESHPLALAFTTLCLKTLGHVH